MRSYVLLVLASLSVAACATGATNDPPMAAPAVAEVKPALDWKTADDVPQSKPLLTIERNGEQLVSLTVYDDAGSPVAVLHPDGVVDVKQGSAGDAAKKFFNALTGVLLTQCGKPKP